MIFLTTQYTLSKGALEIYFSGCKGPHCKGCHNPETQSFSLGTEVGAKELSSIIKAKVQSFGALIESIMILGGEPLDQPHEELEEFVQALSGLNLPIWLFTRYELSEVPFSLRIKFSYIKTGRYLEEFKGEGTQYGITLATSNQKIYKRGLDY